MTQPRSIIVIQTAFIGDAVLTLPMIQQTAKSFPGTAIDVMCIPATAGIFRNNPDVRRVIVYDKRRTERGICGILRMVRTLSRGAYDAALVPHRSMRSALIPALAKVPLRIGFDTSAGAFLMTRIVRYRDDCHEIERDRMLARELGVGGDGRELPVLTPSQSERERASLLIGEQGTGGRCVAIAPGSVWPTKRWLPDRYAEVVRRLDRLNVRSVLIGGKSDEGLCAEIALMSGVSPVNAAGRLTLLESAALIGMTRLLLTNDSAPLHLAVAVGTPVVAIFGPTVPGFGFAPYGESDVVLGTGGLSCRPCAIHGGKKCPIGTFECMKGVSVEGVVAEIMRKL